MQNGRRKFLYSSLGASLFTLGCSSVGTRLNQSSSALNTNNFSDNFTADQAIPLNFNENPLGLAPKVQQAITQALPQAWRYPDRARSELMTELSQSLGLAESQLIYGNGSSEVLKMALDAFAQTNCQLVMPDPSYGVIIDYAMARGISVVKVKLDGYWQTDLAKMQAKVDATRARRLYIYAILTIPQVSCCHKAV